MLGARPLLACALVCALLPALPRPGGADAPVPLDYTAYDGWNAIRTPVVDDDGRLLAYALTPEDGDPTLVVRDLASASERRAPRGTAPAFAARGRFVVYTHTALARDVDAAKKAHKPPAQQPKNGVGILDLSATGDPEVVNDVKTILVARDEGPVIAYRAEVPPSPSPSPASAPSAAPASGSPAPTPSPLPAPKADKTKDTGAALTIRDLVAGTRVVVPNATDVALSDDDRFVAYATQTKDGKGDGVHVYDAVHGTTSDVLTGDGRYRNLALARDGSALAFLSDVASYAQAVPHDALYVVDLRAPKLVAVRAVDVATPGLPTDTTPNTNGTVAFSRDGARVFFGTAPAPTPLPSGTPEPMKVDQWSWNDDVLQSQQKHDADDERKRTYLAVYDLTSRRFAQLASPTLREVERNENPTTALGVDDRAYRRASSWLGEDYRDLYAVSLADGTRRLLARDAPGSALSPAGRYALTWDEHARHWVAIRTADGHRVVLGARSPVTFWFREDDHPLPPQPYGWGGWLADDRAVLLYDREDVWLADPDSGAVRSLTSGAGARAHTVFSPVQPDPDATAYDPAKPILLSLLDERSFASGYARVAADGGTPATLLKVDANVNGFRLPFTAPLHDLARPPLTARHADRYLFTRATFREPANWWATDAAFTQPVRVTDANPQQARYRWGTERLINFTARDGTPLRAVMLVPDGLQPTHAAPMLVYFYEKWAAMFHSYYSPAPGTSPNFTRYVSRGYVVLLPDIHYRVGHPGESAVDSLLPAVDAAVRTGYVNPARIGIAGHSWAAYQINYLLTKTHEFRAAEAGAAVDDMFSAYGGIRLESGIVRESQYEHTQSRIGATPWDRPDLYLENSGLFGIRNVTTPYLTIHNDQDGAVPQFQGIEYVTAMRRLGKIAYLFSFDGEEHNLRGREQQKWWTVHLDEWFDYWLQGAPRPAWFDGVDYLHRGERDVHPLYGEPD
ncbi:MAG TPA: prolyl oligopeptidase family serine peptidase [Candidatus Sulfotelmatobacter sp.]|nr:prolyl oligopeptidase family serine peptidase [Candidatus Sulfotelmatobacter sp.]